MSEKLISIGKVNGVFGVKGWLKIFSYTEPRENVLTYSPWMLKKGRESKEVKVLDGHRHGKTVIARLEGLDDRDKAAALNGWDILIYPKQLPKPRQDEYYWADLVGLQVKTSEGLELGVIDSMLETGANDVIIVRGDRERLIPFIQGQTVMTIDLKIGLMIVDWDADF